MAYYKTNNTQLKTAAQNSTAAATAASISNTGITFITNATTATDTYVLQPPVTGCQKRLVFTSQLTTLAELPVVKSCTTGGDDICIVGATTGINTMSLTSQKVVGQYLTVDLIGINSTSWMIANIFPHTSVVVASLALTSA